MLMQIGDAVEDAAAAAGAQVAGDEVFAVNPEPESLFTPENIAIAGGAAVLLGVGGYVAFRYFRKGR